MAVDHHLLDRGVGEQLLERPEPDRVAQDQLAKLAPALVGEDRRLVVDQLAQPRSARSPRARSGGRLGAAALDEPPPQLGGQRLGVVGDRRHAPKRPLPGAPLPRPAPARARAPTGIGSFEVEERGQAIELSGSGLEPADVVAVARDGAGVELTGAARAAMAASSAAIVERLADSAEPVYGVSTGFGSLATTHIPADAPRGAAASR